VHWSEEWSVQPWEQTLVQLSEHRWEQLSVHTSAHTLDFVMAHSSDSVMAQQLGLMLALTLEPRWRWLVPL
jgi:hypothetical protein